jgi:hypothetical protein
MNTSSVRVYEPNFAVGNNFTIAFWLKTTQNWSANGKTSWEKGAVIVSSSNSSKGNDYGLSMIDGIFTFGSGSSTSEDLLQSDDTYNGKHNILNLNLLDGEWHFLAVTREITTTYSTLSIYTDGIQKSITSNFLTQFVYNNIVLGCKEWGTGNYLNAVMDDFSFFDQPLSEAQLDTLYNQGTIEY